MLGNMRYLGSSLVYLTTVLALSSIKCYVITSATKIKAPVVTQKDDVFVSQASHSQVHMAGPLIVAMATAALQKTASCMLRASDENSLLGLAMATGQLEYALNGMNTRPRQESSQTPIKDALIVLQTVQNHLRSHGNFSLPRSRLRAFRILDERFWRFSLSKRNLLSPEPCASYRHPENRVEFLTEKQTDRCLLEITQRRHGECSITSQCIHDMLEQMDCIGYSGTHQLLFLISYWRMNCGHNLYPSFDLLLSHCARQMYSQFCEIQNDDYPEKMQDIYLEYVLFGGLAGFDEFLKEEIFVKILEWQDNDGCYHVTGNHRSEDEKATIHKTALSSALLGVYASHFALM